MTEDKDTVITESLLTRLEQQLEWLEIVHVTTSSKDKETENDQADL